ncbi:CYTH domain-containing protein [candidate division WOR-3 bacterium]|nr:CYTH domain-containing protein [candidate division WOR-3 bacterium]
MMDEDATERADQHHQTRTTQLKVRGLPADIVLRKLGAERLALVQQVDKYYTKSTPESAVVRIRDEGGTNYVTERITSAEGVASIRLTKVIDDQASLKSYVKAQNMKLTAVVFKERVVYRLGEIAVMLDSIRDLGEFTELHSSNPKDTPFLMRLVETLGLDPGNLETRTYWQLAELSESSRLKTYLKGIYHWVQGLACGIVGGVMTTLGVIIGVTFGVGSTVAVASSILAIALSDSFADAAALFTAELMSPFASRSKAFLRGGTYFVGKAVISSSFIIPFLVIPQAHMFWALAAAAGWGVIITVLLSVPISIVESSRLRSTLARQIGVLALISVLTFLGSRLVIVLVGD